MPDAEASQGLRPVEQKIVSLRLEGGECRDEEKGPVEHLSGYLTEGWKVKQLTSISSGETHGWIVVLLERETNQAV